MLAALIMIMTLSNILQDYTPSLRFALITGKHVRHQVHMRVRSSARHTLGLFTNDSNGTQVLSVV